MSKKAKAPHSLNQIHQSISSLLSTPQGRNQLAASMTASLMTRMFPPSFYGKIQEPHWVNQLESALKPFLVAEKNFSHDGFLTLYLGKNQDSLTIVAFESQGFLNIRLERGHGSKQFDRIYLQFLLKQGIPVQDLVGLFRITAKWF